MTPSPPLPLSQQALAWTLQAMGLLDDLNISRSTGRSALDGRVIPDAWPQLVDDFADELGLPLDEPRRRTLRDALRELDGRVSGLEDLKLPLDIRLPTVLRVALPQVGIRLGALAAMLDTAPRSALLAAAPRASDWLTDPLSAKTFGRIVDGLLMHHHPELSGQGARRDWLDEHKLAGARTVERWRSAQIQVPKRGQVEKLARAMGTPRDQQRALMLLRLGRLCAEARKQLAGWTDEMQAEAVQRALHQWASAARSALRSPQLLAELAETFCLALETDSGEAVASRLGQIWGGAADAPTAPEDLAVWLRTQARQALAEQSPMPLAHLMVLEAVQPTPMLIGAVGQQLGAPEMLRAALDDPFQQIQAEWNIVALARALANGDGVTFGSPAGESRQVVPSEALRELAGGILDHQRTIVRAPDDPVFTDKERLQFMALLLTEAGGPDALAELPELWNAAQEYRSAPVSLEPHLDDEVVAAMPHLAVHRAARLLEAGDQTGGLHWLGTWTRSQGVRPWPERLQAARGLAALGHRYLDGLARLWSKERWNDLDDDTVSPEVRVALARLAERALAADERTVGATERLFEQASALLAGQQAVGATIQRLSVLLPWALRLDWHAAEGAEDDGSFELTRATPLHEELQECLLRQPRDPSAWALLACWQHFVEEDATLATRRAVHFGGQALLDELMEMLRTDGWLEQN